MANAAGRLAKLRQRIRAGGQPAVRYPEAVAERALLDAARGDWGATQVIMDAIHKRLGVEIVIPEGWTDA